MRISQSERSRILRALQSPYYFDQVPMRLDGNGIHPAITFGIPINQYGRLSFDIYSPKICTAARFDIPIHGYRNKSTTYHDVTFIICHAIEDKGWCFADSQPIAQTVSTYNQFAEENSLPRITFISACRPLDYQWWSKEARTLHHSGVCYYSTGEVKDEGLMQNNGLWFSAYPKYDTGHYVNREVLK